MRTNFDLLKLNLKLICRYCIYNYKLCEHLFKRLISTCDSNLIIVLSSKRSLSSNLSNYSREFFSNMIFRCFQVLLGVIIIIMFMLLSFMFLNIIVIIIIIIIVAMYRSQPIYTLSIIIVKH